MPVGSRGRPKRARVTSEHEGLLALIAEGEVYWLTGHFHDALELADQARRQAVEAADDEGAALALDLAAHTHLQLGAFHTALEMFRSNLEAAHVRGSVAAAADANEGIAWILMRTGCHGTDEFANARDLFADVLDARRSLGDRHGEALALTGIANAEAGNADYVQAAETLRAAMVTQAEIGDLGGLAASHFYLGNAYRDYRDDERAFHHLELALSISQDHHLRPVHARSLLARGVLRSWRREDDLALADIEGALVLSDSMGMYPLAYECHEALVTIHERRERFREALYHLRAAGTASDRTQGLPGTEEHHRLALKQALQQANSQGRRRDLVVGAMETNLDASLLFVGIGDTERPADFALYELNSRAADLLGVEPNAVREQVISRIARTGNDPFARVGFPAAKLVDMLRSVAETGQPYEDEVKVHLFGQFQALWLSRRIARFGSYFGLTVSDISRRKQTEDMLRQARMRESEVAAHIQRTLLHAQAPTQIAGAQIAALSVPSQIVDGDFRLFYTFQPHTIDVVLGDVMGKGMPAALLAAAAISIFERSFAHLCGSESSGRTCPPPRHVMSVVQGAIEDKLARLESFITVCHMRFDLERRTAEMVDCGHTGVLHYRARQRKLVVHRGNNLPLGVIEGEPIEQTRIKFGPGDMFLLFSDGVTEAESASGAKFEEPRLHKVFMSSIGRTAKELVEHVLAEVRRFAGAEGPQDDLSCVAVSIDPEAPGA